MKRMRRLTLLRDCKKYPAAQIGVEKVRHVDGGIAKKLGPSFDCGSLCLLRHDDMASMVSNRKTRKWVKVVIWWLAIVVSLQWLLAGSGVRQALIDPALEDAKQVMWVIAHRKQAI